MIDKLCVSVNQFTDVDIDFTSSAGKHCFVAFGFVYTQLMLFLGPILSNPFFNILLSLVIMNSFLSLAIGIRSKSIDMEATVWSLAKIIMYVIVVYACTCLEALPIKMLGLTLANIFYSVLICAETSITMKVTAILFKNKRLQSMADRIDETADKFFPGGNQE